MTGRAFIIGGDAAHLPLPDESVHCIVTSPPYWGKRDYEEDGEPIAGQLGSEDDWHDYLDRLVGWTAEWARVLVPWGSMFINLGDKFSDRGHGPNQGRGTSRGPQGGGTLAQSRGAREKSLLMLPHRYAIRCMDELGLICRADAVWEANRLPASAADRFRFDHETVLHLVKRPRYYHATDLIREPIGHPGKSRTSAKARAAWEWAGEWKAKQGGLAGGGENPLGRIPGSVWRIPTYPLKCPRYYWREPGGAVRWLRDDAEAWRWVRDTGRDRSVLPRGDAGAELRAAPDHYAAFAPDLIRPLLLGWCPQEVCTVCGQGRFPVTERARVIDSGDGAHIPGTEQLANGAAVTGFAQPSKWHTVSAVTGWACGCTPATLRRPRSERAPTATPGPMYGRGPGAQDAHAAATGRRHHGNNWPEREPQKLYQLDGWTPPPTRPGIVLDPCGGTGTVALVASMLGMTGLSVEISGDYRLLSTWRVADPGERAAALGTARPKVEPHDQAAMFDVRGEPLLES